MRPWFLLVLLAGCVSEPWYVDERFTELETAAIVQAARAWELSTGEPMYLELHSDAYRPPWQRSIIRADVSAMSPRQSGKYDAPNIYLTPTRIGNVYGAWRLAAMHEFGHSFGLSHVNDERAVMWPTLRPPGPIPDCVTTLDAAAYTAVTGQVARGCSLSGIR